MNTSDLITLEYKDIFDNNINKKIQFSSTLLNKSYNLASLFPLIVDGKSMEPMIKDRAIIVSDLSQKVVINNAIYIIYKDEKMWVKKACKNNDEIKFISINKDFSHLIYEEKDVHVVARVLLTFTSF